MLPGLEAPVRVASLGSGSRGNGTLVSIGGVSVLIDCGFTLRETMARLRRLHTDASELSAILVTHEHADHIHGVAPLARRYHLPVYLSLGTLRGMEPYQDLDLRPFRAGAELDIRGVGVTTVPVPHDSREPAHFIVEGSGSRVGVLTDLGHVPRSVRERFARCTVLLVESNHDREMLLQGTYPWPLKRRIVGDLGHLSNEQTVEFLTHIAHDDLEHVVVGHISEQNNSPARLRHAFLGLQRRLRRLTYATQCGDAQWLEWFDSYRRIGANVAVHTAANVSVPSASTP